MKKTIKKKVRTAASRRRAANLAWATRRANAMQAAPVLNMDEFESVSPAVKKIVYKHLINGRADRTRALSKILPMGEPGYETLAYELQAAFDQSAKGKGVERHGNGLSFDKQPICEITRVVGPGFATGQALKKITEAVGMHQAGDPERAISELHGAMVYLAAAAKHMRG